MLALRNAVCNDRGPEMWQKALGQDRKLQAFQRSERVKQRAQAFLAVSDASSQESPPQSVAALKPLPSLALSQHVSKAESSPVIPPPAVPAATRPSSCRPSSRRKQHTARNRVKYSHQRSGEGSGETCVCGTPLVQSIG